MDKLFDIIHEDDELLVINKPADLVCHPTKGDEYSSLISRVRLHLGADAKPHLVNRLDRETSGVTLVAKTAAVAGELGKLWEARVVEKEYVAIVYGHVREEHGLIDAALGKDVESIVAIKDCVRADGAASQTEFWVERRFVRRESASDGRARHSVRAASEIRESSSRAQRAEDCSPYLAACGEGTYSLLRLLPRTGRKHQIRIHLAHIGHPIVGDKIYGGDVDLYLALVEGRLTEAQRVKLILPNHALHATALRFAWRGRVVEFRCKPEMWFTNFLTTDAWR